MYIYETAVLLDSSADEATIQNVISSVKSAVEAENGEVLITDEWGNKYLAQPTSTGTKKGYYVYFMYKAVGSVNAEIERRFRINEKVIKHLMIKLGDESKEKEIVKAYKTPYSSNAAWRPGEQAEGSSEKDKKMFARKRSCWFTANKISPDWRNPETYRWLINEFGKISPARVSSLSAKFQRCATSEIKRARCIGLVSHISNRTAQ